MLCNSSKGMQITDTMCLGTRGSDWGVEGGRPATWQQASLGVSNRDTSWSSQDQSRKIILGVSNLKQRQKNIYHVNNNTKTYNWKFYQGPYCQKLRKWLAFFIPGGLDLFGEFSFRRVGGIKCVLGIPTHFQINKLQLDHQHHILSVIFKF